VNIDLLEKRENQINCDCNQHADLTNYTLTDIDVKNSIMIRRVQIKGKSYLAILYDQIALSAPELE